MPDYLHSFNYRYVRAEVIAGFVNALFLLFIAFFIFAEAIEVRRCNNWSFCFHFHCLLFLLAGI